MKKVFLFTNLFFLCLVICFSAQAKDVGGIIDKDTIWTKADSPIVVISENSSSGILALSSTVAIQNSTISGNSAYSFGGGIYSLSSTVIIQNSTISGNSSSNQ